jgi:hypothetical protein
VLTGFEHVLHHLFGFLTECWRILRRDGVLLVDISNPATLANALRVLVGRSPTWGDRDFALNPKLGDEDGQRFYAWDIHFREYFADDLAAIVSGLPSIRILERGFVATESAPSEAAARRMAKRLVWRAGLGRARPFCQTQFVFARRA